MNDLAWADLSAVDDPVLVAWLAEAEECMRGAGLWPWHDRASGTDEADG